MSFDSTLERLDSNLCRFDSDVWGMPSVPQASYTAGSYSGSLVTVPDSATEVYVEVPRMSSLDSSLWTDPSVNATVGVEVNGVTVAEFTSTGGTLPGLNGKEGTSSGIKVPIPAGSNRQVRANFSLNGTAKTFCKVGLRPSIPKPQLITLSGLDWSGNENTAFERRIVFTNPFPIYDATYIFRVFPRRKSTGPNQRYYTTFFWGNNGIFQWDGGFGNTYYGGHPYPVPAPNGFGQWEISTEANDFVTGTEVEWDRWYTQAFRAWRTSPSQTNHEFYYDLPDTGKVLSHTINDPGWADANPPSPAIVVGQAPNRGDGFSWGGSTGFEEFNGIIRGMQFYSSLLTLPQITSELATPGSVVTPWYLNLNPTVTDISDKSGGAHHPVWEGVDRPTLWVG